MQGDPFRVYKPRGNFWLQTGGPFRAPVNNALLCVINCPKIDSGLWQKNSAGLYLIFGKISEELEIEVITTK